MTGSGAGALDFDWLKNNLCIEKIGFSNPEDPADAADEQLFLCFNHKAFQAAEIFLLARYHLYTQVYLHKTTRGAEQLIAAILKSVIDAVRKEKEEDVCLSRDHPLAYFYRSEGKDLKSYLALDDFCLWELFAQMSKAKDSYVRDMSKRLRNRELFHALDMDEFDGQESRRQHIRWIEKKFKDEINTFVLKDSVELGVYGVVGIDDEKMHLRMMIKPADGGTPYEIQEKSGVINGMLMQERGKQVGKKQFVRFYFADESNVEIARKNTGGQHG